MKRDEVCLLYVKMNWKWSEDEVSEKENRWSKLKWSEDEVSEKENRWSKLKWSEDEVNENEMKMNLQKRI